MTSSFQYVNSKLNKQSKKLKQNVQLYNEILSKLSEEYGKDAVTNALHIVAEDVRALHLRDDKDVLETSLSLFEEEDYTDAMIELIEEDQKDKAAFYSNIDDVTILAIGYIDNYRMDTLSCLTSLLIEVSKVQFYKASVEEIEELFPASEVEAAKKKAESRPFYMGMLGGRIISENYNVVYEAFKETYEREQSLKKN